MIRPHDFGSVTYGLLLFSFSSSVSILTALGSYLKLLRKGSESTFPSADGNQGKNGSWCWFHIGET